LAEAPGAKVWDSKKPKKADETMSRDQRQINGQTDQKRCDADQGRRTKLPKKEKK